MDQVNSVLNAAGYAHTDEVLFAGLERYRHLFANMRYGYVYCQIIVDHEGRAVDFIHKEVNKSYEKLTGLTNVVGRKATELFPDIRNSNPGFIERHLMVAETGIPDHFELNLALLHKWFDVSVVSEKRGYFTVIIDEITERKKVEDALRKSERNFRSITEQIADQVFVADSNGTLTYVSPAVEELFGYLPHEVIGQPFIDYIAEEEIPEALQVFNNTLQHKRANQIFEFKLKKKDSSLFDGEIHLQYYQDQEISGMIGLISDITDRKRQECIHKEYEQRILESKERFEATIEAAQIGTWEWNVQTGEAILNDRWFDIVGYIPEELAPVSIQTWMDLTHPDDLRQSMAIAEKHFNGELEHYTYECRMKHKNGHWVWILDRGKVLTRTLDGKPLRMLGTHIDITERKLAAEESERLKSAFIRNISHEIRTPMNGIFGFSELLKEPYLSGEEQTKYIDLIQQSGQRMLNLINDLMEISKIDAKDVKVHITETPLNQLLRDLVAFFKPEAINKGLSLSCTTGLTDQESIIQTDSVKLTKIVTTLIQNALKFTSKGSISLGYTCAESMLDFYVIDSGIGISPVMKERIFDRFHQVDNSLIRNHEGAGLGLSISKAYVEILGGTIKVESAEERGSKFIFTLPYHPMGHR